MATILLFAPLVGAIIAGLFWKAIGEKTGQVIATALLFLSAILCCALVLILAGFGLTTFYRRSAERGFDERLSVYIKQLVADLAAPPETERQTIGDLGEPRFDLPLTGWYWQITRLDGERPNVRASRSLVGGQLPKLLDQSIAPNSRGLRESYVSGPDDRRRRQQDRSVRRALHDRDGLLRLHLGEDLRDPGEAVLDAHRRGRDQHLGRRERVATHGTVVAGADRHGHAQVLDRATRQLVHPAGGGDRAGHEQVVDAAAEHVRSGADVVE